MTTMSAVEATLPSTAYTSAASTPVPESAHIHTVPSSPTTQVLSSSNKSDPPTPRKRKQVKNACVNCQKACKKCDDARPCGRCVKYGIQDSCTDSVRKERKKVKRGPYKRKSSQDGDLDGYVYDLPSAYHYSSMSHGLPFSGSSRPFDNTYIKRELRASMQQDDAAQGFYSDDDATYTRKRQESEDNKLGVLANLCSAVLDHSRANSPTRDIEADSVSSNSNFDPDALEALSAPIKSSSRSRSISEDSYHHSVFMKSQPRTSLSSIPDVSTNSLYGSKLFSTPFTSSLPSFQQSLQASIIKAQPLPPITPPRSSGEIPSYPPTPQGQQS